MIMVRKEKAGPESLKTKVWTLVLTRKCTRVDFCPNQNLTPIYLRTFVTEIMDFCPVVPT